MKILRNLCLHFARHGGQDGNKWKENHATKVTKIQKNKRQKYGMNEAIDECHRESTYHLGSKHFCMYCRSNHNIQHLHNPH